MWSFLKQFEGTQPGKRKPVAATTNESVRQSEKKSNLKQRENFNYTCFNKFMYWFPGLYNVREC